MLARLLVIVLSGSILGACGTTERTTVVVPTPSNGNTTVVTPPGS